MLGLVGVHSFAQLLALAFPSQSIPSAKAVRTHPYTPHSDGHTTPPYTFHLTAMYTHTVLAYVLGSILHITDVQIREHLFYIYIVLHFFPLRSTMIYLCGFVYQTVTFPFLTSVSIDFVLLRLIYVNNLSSEWLLKKQLYVKHGGFM